jgi:hypothetical protein
MVNSGLSSINDKIGNEMRFKVPENSSRCSVKKIFVADRAKLSDHLQFVFHVHCKAVHKFNYILVFHALNNVDLSLNV